MVQLLVTFGSLSDDGVAINLSGSQRMRTMLLSNYSLMYQSSQNGTLSYNEGEIKKVLTEELGKYKKIMNALEKGDESLNISTNDDEDILNVLVDLKPEIEKYTKAVQSMIDGEELEKNVTYIVSNALNIKNEIHGIVQMYQKNYDMKINNFKVMLYVYLVIGIIVLFIGKIIANRIITKPIKNIANKLGEIASGQGDLSQEIDYKSNDEIGLLSRNFNTFLGNIRNMVKTINDTSDSVLELATMLSGTTEEVACSSDGLAATMNEIAQGATEQAHEVLEIAGNMNELGSKIQEINDISVKMKESSNEVMTINSGNKVNVDVLYNHSIENLKAVDEINIAIEKLYNNANKISLITEVINGIANQTNLLSLNASIEAARAGEQGRGFAIVANEVSSLAEQSAESASQISQIVLQIQNDVNNTKQLMEHTMQLTTEQSEAVKVTKSDFEAISVTIGNIAGQIEGVSSKISVVDNNKNEVSTSIGNISAVTEESAASTEEFAAFSDEFQQSLSGINDVTVELKTSAEGLSKIISKFKY